MDGEGSAAQRPWSGLALLVCLAAPFLVLLARVVATQFADPDLWGRISVGAVLAQAGHLPRVDDFSWTARGATWIDHEWGTGVILYAVLAATGEAGLHVFKYALAASALAAVFLLHRSVYRVPPWFAACALTATVPLYLMGFATTLRSQVFSFVFFLFTLLLLERIRTRRTPLARLAWLPLFGVLWGNLHGGVIMGVMAAGLYGAAEGLKGHWREAALHVAAAVGMLAALAVVNPYGLDYMRFLIHAWTLDRSAITEWRPLLAGPFHLGTALALAVVALAVGHAGWGLVDALRARWQRRAAAPDSDVAAPSLVLLLLVVMTLMSLRIQTFLVLTLCATLPAFYSGGDGKATLASRVGRFIALPPPALRVALPAAACVLGGALLVVALQSRPLLASIVPDGRESGPRGFAYPVAAVRALQASPLSGRLLNPFSPGQFLYWNLYPRFRVAMDGRYEEVYTPEQFATVFRFYKDHRPRQAELLVRTVDDFGVDLVLFRSVWRNHRALADARGFASLQDDGVHALVGRTTLPAFEAPVERDARPPTIADFFAGRDGRFADYP